MKIMKLDCPYCGASINLDSDDRKECFCSYCGRKVYIDDEVSRSEYKETKENTVNINHRKEARYVNEAELQKAKNEGRGMKYFFIIFLLMILVSAVSAITGYTYGGTKIIKVPNNSVEVTFKEAVLGKAEEKNSLIVMEQELSVASTIVKEGLFEWGIFKKNKDITYVGKAIYTLNLNQIRENDIEVDSESKTVKIYVPKPQMHDLIIDPNDFHLGNTEKGLLSFGDIKFTLEEAFYIESQAVESLKKRAEDEKILKDAEKIAGGKVLDLFSRTVASVDPEYKLRIEFY